MEGQSGDMIGGSCLSDLLGCVWVFSDIRGGWFAAKVSLRTSVLEVFMQLTAVRGLGVEASLLNTGPEKNVQQSELADSLSSVANVPGRDSTAPARALFPTVEGAKSGLLYGEAIQSVADRYGVVLAFRSPNPLGASLLNEGVASKNFHVKAKSSGTGPTAGFIALNPAYSKVGATQLSDQQRSLDRALACGARPVNLVLSCARIAELRETGHMKQVDSAYRAEYPSGVSALFRIDEQGRVFDEGGPVQVLSNPGDDRAITADYDLFAIYPRQAQADNQRPLHVPARLVGNVSEIQRRRAMPWITPRPAFEGAREHDDMGNIHGFGTTIVKALNEQIRSAGYAGGNLVWHNDETGNPFSAGFDPQDEPVFFFPGNRLTGQALEPRQVSSREELLALQGWLRDEGFHVEYSPRFGF